MAAQERVYILSPDYWGFDPATQDTALNFFTNVWTLPKATYDGLGEEDRQRLYRCALFYHTKRVDNHGFTPIAIFDKDNDLMVRGTGRGGLPQVRKYSKGSQSPPYTVDTITMAAADPSATTWDELADQSKQSADGTFTIGSYMFDETKIMETINNLESEVGTIVGASAAESYAAESTPASVAVNVSEPLSVNPTAEAPSGSEVTYEAPANRTDREGPQRPTLKHRMSAKDRAMARRKAREAKESRIQAGLRDTLEAETEMSQLMTTNAFGQAGADYDHEIHYRADSIEDDREPIYQDCLVCGETQYMNDGGVYAYDDGTDQPICYKPACVSKWKQVEAAYDKSDDEGYKVYEKLFGADSLGAEDEAVLAHYANWSEDSTMLSGNGVPTYYGSAETFEAQSSTKEMNEAYKQYKMNLEKYVGFGDLWEKIHEESLRLQSQGLIAFDAWNEACKKFKVFDKLTKGVNMKHLREREKRYEPDSYYGNAESFEAPMARYSPGKGDVDRVLASLRSRYSGLQVKGTPIYMTMRSGSSNKYHVFVRTNKGNFNGYGRIGYAPTIHGPMSDSEYDRKLRAKQRPSKGYEETKYAEADYSPLAEAPSPYEPYSFMDEMTPNGEFITSDEFMELMSETLDGMSLRYEKPSMFGSPLAMGVGGVLVAALGYKLWSKRSDSTE